MKIDKLKNKIDNQYRLYLSEDNEFDLFALENMLIELMNIDTSFGMKYKHWWDFIYKIHRRF